MKIDELKIALKSMIRAEVKKAVAEEVSKAMGKVLVEMVKEIKTNNPAPRIVQESVEVEEEEGLTPDAPILKTNNPKLNSVLAETARRFRPLQRTADGAGLAELMDGGFDKIGQGETAGIKQPATNLDFLKQMVSQSPQATNQPSALDGGSEVPDVLKKVFKKDFRAVMKKIDEQKKNGGGGYIDPSRLMG
jgi:hypothetical protein